MASTSLAGPAAVFPACTFWTSHAACTIAIAGDYSASLVRLWHLYSITTTQVESIAIIVDDIPRTLLCYHCNLFQFYLDDLMVLNGTEFTRNYGRVGISFSFEAHRDAFFGIQSYASPQCQGHFTQEIQRVHDPD